MVISKPVVEHSPKTAPAQAPIHITLSPKPGDSNYLLLHLPLEMKNPHLETVKNIHGRKWNPEQKVWEVP